MKTDYAALLAHYESMSRFALGMLDAARQGEWDRVTEIEGQRSVVEAALREGDHATWPAAEAGRKRALLERILASDAETRRLAEENMRALQDALGSASTSRKLQRAYDTR